MTPYSIIQVSAITIYVLIVVANLPAFWRLIRGDSKVFDGIKSCVALVAITLINATIIRKGLNFSLANVDSVERMAAVALTGFAFLTLLFVIFRTENALHGIDRNS